MFKMPIVVTEQYPEGLGNTVKTIEEQFTVLEVVEKIELAATENRQFMEKINTLGCDTFVVCGIETHVCINQTVLGLLSLGKTVHVVADAVGSRHAIDHTTGIRKMENAGALVTTTEMAMFELAERAGTESFKNIQRMVKAQKARTGPGAPATAKRPVPQKEASVKKEKSDGPAAAPPAPKRETSVAAQEKPAGQALGAPASTDETEAVDLIDLELAAAAEKKPEKKPDVLAPKGITHSSSDIDSAGEVDINDMLSSIDVKVDAQETIGPVSEEIDKGIADLDEIIKAEEKTEKEPPDLK